jgi:neuronal growth regulator 1
MSNNSTRIKVIYFLVLCEQKPFISHVSKEKIKEIGEEVEFNCTVQNTQDYPVLWIKFDKDRLDRAPLSSNNFMIVRDKRISVNFDSVTSTYSLKV